MAMRKIRNYEVSIWTLQDSFITVLKYATLENKGQIQQPEIDLVDDGTQEFNFKIPMYLIQDGEKKENPIWYNTTNGNIIADLRKIKVIINKNGTQLDELQEDEQQQGVFEFIITKVTETHQNNELTCQVHCEGLAFHELGKVGYKIELSTDQFYRQDLSWFKSTQGSKGDYPVVASQENQQTNQQENQQEDQQNTQQENQQTSEQPKATLSYWNDKIFKYKDASTGQMKWKGNWQYEINMDWSGYLLGDTARDQHQVYEDSYVSSWNYSNNDNSLTPRQIEVSKLKERMVDLKESNIYNLTQDLAETFGVYCKYVYEHDNNYHITGRKVIYYNNFLNEKYGFLDLTYPYSSSSISREMDAIDTVTKMYIKPVTSETSSDGYLTIMNSEANKSKQDYLLNFDYLRGIGAITDEQYNYIEQYQAKMRKLNEILVPLAAEIVNIQQEKVIVDAAVTSYTNAISLDSQRIAATNNLLASITNGTGILQVTAQKPKSAVLLQDSSTKTDSSDYYLRLTQQGIKPQTLHIYRTYSYMSNGADRLSNQITGTLQYDEFNNLIGVRQLYLQGSLNNQSSSRTVYLTYDYQPKLHYDNVKKSWESRLSIDTQKLNQNITKQQNLDSAYTTKKQYYDNIIQQKQAAIREFELMMGPALRQGYWMPDDYDDYGDKYSSTFTHGFCLGQKVWDSSKGQYKTDAYGDLIYQYNGSDYNDRHGYATIMWDRVPFDEQQLCYYTTGIQQERRYYPCIKLRQQHLKYIQTHKNVGLAFYDISMNQTLENLRYYSIGSQCQLGFLADRYGRVFPVLFITGADTFVDKQMYCLQGQGEKIKVSSSTSGKTQNIKTVSKDKVVSKTLTNDVTKRDTDGYQYINDKFLTNKQIKVTGKETTTVQTTTTYNKSGKKLYNKQQTKIITDYDIPDYGDDDDDGNIANKIIDEIKQHKIVEKLQDGSIVTTQWPIVNNLNGASEDDEPTIITVIGTTETIDIIWNKDNNVSEGIKKTISTIYQQKIEWIGKVNSEDIYSITNTTKVKYTYRYALTLKEVEQQIRENANYSSIFTPNPSDVVTVSYKGVKQTGTNTKITVIRYFTSNDIISNDTFNDNFTSSNTKVEYKVEKIVSNQVEQTWEWQNEKEDGVTLNVTAYPQADSEITITTKNINSQQWNYYIYTYTPSSNMNSYNIPSNAVLIKKVAYSTESDTNSQNNKIQIITETETTLEVDLSSENDDQGKYIKKTIITKIDSTEKNNVSKSISVSQRTTEKDKTFTIEDSIARLSVLTYNYITDGQGNTIQVQVVQLTKEQEVDGQEVTIKDVEKINPIYNNTINDDLSVNPTVITDGPATDWIDAGQKINGEYKYQQVFPRIRINSSSLKDSSNQFSLVYDEYNLQMYVDYSVLTRHGIYYISPKFSTLIQSGILSQEDISSTKVKVSDSGSINFGDFKLYYCLSNADTSIYLDAIQVLKQSAYPKVSYTIDVNVANENFIKYDYNKMGYIAHINDEELKFRNVMGYISEIRLNLDKPWEDEITIKNYKTKFQDLFSKIVASSQQMRKNEYIIGLASDAFSQDGTISSQTLSNSIMKVDLNYAFNNGKLTINQKDGIWGTSDSGVVAFRGGGIFTSTAKDANGNWIWNTGITPEGINANLITTGQLDTNRVKIYSGSKLRFQLNGDGLFAYKTFRQDVDVISSDAGATNTTIAELNNKIKNEIDGYTKNEYVVFNQNGLFLKAEAGATIYNNLEHRYRTINSQVNRVQIGWQGFKLRNWDNEEVLYADADTGNLVISGTIYATQGKIGGFTIGDNYLSTRNKSNFNDLGQAGIYFGEDGISLGKGVFSVNQTGYLTANQGYIGKWRLSQGVLYSVPKVQREVDNNLVDTDEDDWSNGIVLNAARGTFSSTQNNTYAIWAGAKEPQGKTQTKKFLAVDSNGDPIYDTISPTTNDEGQLIYQAYIQNGQQVQYSCTIGISNKKTTVTTINNESVNEGNGYYEHSNYIYKKITNSNETIYYVYPKDSKGNIIYNTVTTENNQTTYNIDVYIAVQKRQLRYIQKEIKVDAPFRLKRNGELYTNKLYANEVYSLCVKEVSSGGGQNETTTLPYYVSIGNLFAQVSDLKNLGLTASTTSSGKVTLSLVKNGSKTVNFNSAGSVYVSSATATGQNTADGKITINTSIELSNNKVFTNKPITFTPDGWTHGTFTQVSALEVEYQLVDDIRNHIDYVANTEMWSYQGGQLTSKGSGRWYLADKYYNKNDFRIHTNDVSVYTCPGSTYWKKNN